MRYREIFFISGRADHKDVDDAILEMRKNNAFCRIDVAANSYAGAYIEGLESHFARPLTLVGDSYIRRTGPGRRSVVRRHEWSHSFGSDDAHIAVIDQNKAMNLASKAVSLFTELLKRTLLKRKNVLFIVYSVHFPYVLPVFLLKFLFPRIRTCVIIPDLPEYMDSEIERKPIKRLFKGIEKPFLKWILSRFDSAVLITDHIKDWIGKGKGPRCLTVEGLMDMKGLRRPERRERENAFLYTGTLDERFGIIDLIDAYEMIDDPEYELWICGFGDCASRIEAAAKRNAKIRYFGVVTREKALELQRSVKLLVNPRSPLGEYTKYSFPSKTLEYLVSGTPILMRRLPGVPEEYFNYIYADDGNSVESLSNCIKRLMARDARLIDGDGLAGLEFALKHKNQIVATKPVYDMLIEL